MCRIRTLRKKESADLIEFVDTERLIPSGLSLLPRDTMMPIERSSVESPGSGIGKIGTMPMRGPRLAIRQSGMGYPSLSWRFWVAAAASVVRSLEIARAIVSILTITIGQTIFGVDCVIAAIGVLVLSRIIQTFCWRRLGILVRKCNALHHSGRTASACLAHF